MDHPTMKLLDTLAEDIADALTVLINGRMTDDQTIRLTDATIQLARLSDAVKRILHP